jgi:hypothetical protein
MKFRDGMNGVVPILSDLPPKTTLGRQDGTHSGNPAVREAVANGEFAACDSGQRIVRMGGAVLGSPEAISTRTGATRISGRLS